MPQPLWANRTFLRLFSSQLIALTGTGLATVALALLAYQLQPESAGALLGSLLAVKMVAYLLIAPVAASIAERFSRKGWLIGVNLLRALVLCCLPWVNDIWQVVVLIFALNAATAAYTPIYQAMLPDLLPDEEQYTKALSWSRIAVEVESLVSPSLAALLLLIMGSAQLFNLNALALFLTVIIIATTSLPPRQPAERSGGWQQQALFGIRAYLATPRLRGLLALHWVVSCTGAMVIVNTVVYVRQYLGLSEAMVGWAMAASGAGAMLIALFLPRLLNVVHDRPVMLVGGAIGVVALALAALQPGLTGLLMLWFMIGASLSLVLTPAGRVLRLSCRESDRGAYFAANFALSHGGWLLAYLLSGWSLNWLGISFSFMLMAVVAGIGLAAALWLWPVSEQAELEHLHPAMDHEHLHYHDEHHQHSHQGWEGPEPHAHNHHHPELRHRHRFVIDEHHMHWPG